MSIIWVQNRFSNAVNAVPDARRKEAMDKPTILVVPPTHLYKKLFSDEADGRLLRLGVVVRNDTDADWTADDLRQRIRDATVLVTGWRTPRLSDEILDEAPNLKLVAHSAGSVKFMLDERLMERNIAVSTAGAAMVDSVAETTML